MNESLLNILSAIVISQLLLLSAFLFTIRKGKKISNLILAIFFLLLAINLSDGLLVYYGFYNKFPAFAHIEDGFVFFFGPLLYFYTRSLIEKNFIFRWKHLLHALPFLVFTVLFQVFYQLQNEEYRKIIQISIQRQTLPAGFYFSVVLVYIHVFIYLYEAYGKIRTYRKQVRQHFSNYTQLSLNWLLFMLIFFAAILVLSLVYTFLPLTSLEPHFDTGLVILVATFFVFINMVVWKALKFPEIFSGFDQKPEKPKYAGNTFNHLELKSAVSSLETVMKIDKPYLNPSLTIEQLAEKLTMQERKLSQVINQHYQQNFFDFINSWRIEEAKRIMQESSDSKLTVLEVMYQSGFNSKSSFNTLFKKKTGQTPSEYKKEHYEIRSTLH